MGEERKSMWDVWHEFSAQCTSHGISHAEAAPTEGWKRFWWVVFFVCISIMSYQLAETIYMYLQYDKVDQRKKVAALELHFGQAVFPAITICNQNPYKNSRLQGHPDVKQTLDMMQDALDSVTAKSPPPPTRRKRASLTHYDHQPARGKCKKCKTDRLGNVLNCFIDNVDLAGVNSVQFEDGTDCICDYEVSTKLAWPCYPANRWHRAVCADCRTDGHCRVPDSLKHHVVAKKRLLQAIDQGKINEKKLADLLHHRLEQSLKSTVTAADIQRHTLCICSLEYNQCLIAPQNKLRQSRLDAKKKLAEQQRLDEEESNVDVTPSTTTMSPDSEVTSRSSSPLSAEVAEVDEEFFDNYADLYGQNQWRRYGLYDSGSSGVSAGAGQGSTADEGGEAAIPSLSLAQLMSSIDTLAISAPDESTAAIGEAEDDSVVVVDDGDFVDDLPSIVVIDSQDDEGPIQIYDRFGACLQECLPFASHIPVEFTGDSLSKLARSNVTAAPTTTTTLAPAKQEKKRKLTAAMGYSDVTDELAVSTRGRENLMFAVQGLSREDRIHASHDLEQLTRKCVFAGKQCDFENDFTLVVDAVFGNCYTYNFNASNAMMTSRAGRDYGLRLLLYADVDEMIPTTESVGFQITAHAQLSPPFPDVQGVSVSVGTQTSLVLKRKGYQRLSEPYGECYESKEEGVIAPDDYIYEERQYTIEGCFRSCSQRRMIRLCGCAHPLYPVPANETVCEVGDDLARACLEEEVKRFADVFSSVCHCPPPCAEMVYELAYSETKWPASQGKVADCARGDEQCVNNYRRNAAIVQIYYSDLGYESFFEEPAYTSLDLYNDFGGIFGLWLGISLISFLEVTIFLYNFLSAWRAEKVEEKRRQKDEGRLEEEEKALLAELEDQLSVESGLTDVIDKLLALGYTSEDAWSRATTPSLHLDDSMRRVADGQRDGVFTFAGDRELFQSSASDMRSGGSNSRSKSTQLTTAPTSPESMRKL